MTIVKEEHRTCNQGSNNCLYNLALPQLKLTLLYLRYCEEGLIEAVATLIWAAPRLQSEVNELKVVIPWSVFLDTVCLSFKCV